MNTKLTAGALLGFSLACLSPMAVAGNPPPTRAEMNRPITAARTEAECLDQWRRQITDPRPRGQNEGLPPDQMCMNSMKIPADQGRCKEIYTAIIRAYDQAEESVKIICKLVPEAYQSKCDNQGQCLNASAEFQAKYAENLKIHAGFVNELITELDRMGKLGLDVTEQYANDLKEFKATADKTQASEKAARNGGTTIAEALRNHVDQNAETVMSILQRARQSSTISQQEIERSVRSPYVFEQLQASATAFDQKQELERYSRNLQAQQLQAENHATRLNQSGTNMNSVPAASSSLAGLSVPAAALPAAPGVAAPVSATSYPAPEFTGSTIASPASGETLQASPKARTKSADGRVAADSNRLGLSAAAVKTNTAGGVVTALNPVGEAAGSFNSTGASVPGGSALRDEIRARMAKLKAGKSGGAGAGSGASLTAQSQEGAAAENRKAAENEVLAEAGGQFADTRMPAMTMPTSETEGAVKGLVNDFESSLHGDRSPASADTESGNEILTSESPSLFLRLKEVHERCIKRGCVMRASKGKI